MREGRSLRRVLEDPARVTNGHGDDDGRPAGPDGESVAQPGIEGQAGDALGDADRERVEEGAGEPGRRAQKRQGNPDDGVISERQGKRDEDQDAGAWSPRTCPNTVRVGGQKAGSSVRAVGFLPPFLDTRLRE